MPIFSENIKKTQGQFKNAILETVFWNKSCCQWQEFTNTEYHLLSDDSDYDSEYFDSEND